MNIKVLARSAFATGLLGLGMLAGTIAGTSGAFAQTAVGSATPAAQVATTPTAGSSAEPSRTHR